MQRGGAFVDELWEFRRLVRWDPVPLARQASLDAVCRVLLHTLPPPVIPDGLVQFVTPTVPQGHVSIDQDFLAIGNRGHVNPLPRRILGWGVPDLKFRTISPKTWGKALDTMTFTLIVWQPSRPKVFMQGPVLHYIMEALMHEVPHTLGAKVRAAM